MRPVSICQGYRRKPRCRKDPELSTSPATFRIIKSKSIFFFTRRQLDSRSKVWLTIIKVHFNAIGRCKCVCVLDKHHSVDWEPSTRKRKPIKRNAHSRDFIEWNFFIFVRKKVIFVNIIQRPASWLLNWRCIGWWGWGMGAGGRTVWDCRWRKLQ